MNVYYSSIYNCQKIGNNPNVLQRIEYIVVQPYSEIQLSKKKKPIIYTHNNLDEF